MKLLINLNIQTLHKKEELFDLGFKKGDLGSFKKGGNGLYVLEEKIIPCNSLTRNFSSFLSNYFMDMSTAVIDTANQSRLATNGTTGGSTTKLGCTNVMYPAGVTTGGILLGTGTTAVTISDHTIQTLIAHGTGSGQLSYGQNNVGGWTTTINTSQMNTNRTFTNNSGSNITNINEVALVVRMNSSAQHFLIERTVLSSAQTINNGANKTFNYEFTVTL